jgi:hypothetical protein
VSDSVTKIFGHRAAGDWSALPADCGMHHDVGMCLSQLIDNVIERF